jgi:hypothetical protein
VATLLGEDESAGRLENRVEAFENRVVGEGDLVEEDEVAASHGLDERTVVPLEESGGGAHAISESLGGNVLLLLRKRFDKGEDVLKVRFRLGGYFLLVLLEKLDGLVPETGLESGAVAERTLTTEKVGGFGVLVASDDVELAAESMRESCEREEASARAWRGRRQREKGEKRGKKRRRTHLDRPKSFRNQSLRREVQARCVESTRR